MHAIASCCGFLAVAGLKYSAQKQIGKERPCSRSVVEGTEAGAQDRSLKQKLWRKHAVPAGSLMYHPQWPGPTSLSNHTSVQICPQETQIWVIPRSSSTWRRLPLDCVKLTLKTSTPDFKSEKNRRKPNKKPYLSECILAVTS